MLLPSWDCLPYDRIGPSSGVSATRMATLSRLARGLGETKPAILVMPAPALLQRVPTKDVLLRASYSARVGNVVDIKDLERYFAVNGYARASTVSERGEFAIRGGVIDVYPPAAEEPVRLDLFGDTLESIRAFDPRDPALDQAAEGDRPSAGQRGPAGRRRDFAVPQGLCRGVRRAGR